MNQVPKHNSNQESGFSLLELLIAMTISLVIIGLGVTLLAQSLNRRERDQTQAEILSDANQALNLMSKEVTNSGFGLTSNGLGSAESTEGSIRVRSNLNSLMKQTSSGTVNDQDEDVIFQLVANPNGDTSSLVRTDVGMATPAILATQINDADTDADGDGDGLTFIYRDVNGAVTTLPANAVRVEINLNVSLPQVGQPDDPGFQPAVTKVLTSSVVLRNSRLVAY